MEIPRFKVEKVSKGKNIYGAKGEQYIDRKF